ncbi:hypothetical protein [Brevundimonas sp.]|uniref:hypothetical protein n=1 Tax=Brevundimonas sp. TaxID=1871086 RepID=UPI001A242FD5|nr:hypothetical protein [Brevundimonas sp.]MBJ7484434.1 hypothetical protein [Brevundimonas sp.]
MTLIFEDKTVEKGLHAFVIGVGDFPFAKPDLGTNPKLQAVRDLPSAADSAKLMCDWLLANRDSMTPRLRSLEVLISDVPGGDTRYLARDARVLQPIGRADSATVPTAGGDWIGRLDEDEGSTAFFYACGHGANHGMQPVLFLSDINRRTGGDAWSHLNIGVMAQAFRQKPEIAAASFLLDACGEYVPVFPDNARENGFITPDIPGPTDRDKVWLLAAASAGSLAYPGVSTEDLLHDPRYAPQFEEKVDSGSGVRFGRFTQTLIKGLEGSSSRWSNAGWHVDAMGLWSDLRQLHRIYFPAWKDKPFEPSQVMSPNIRLTLIRHDAPRLPVVVEIDPPQRAADFDLRIGLSGDGDQPWIGVGGGRTPGPWVTHIAADRSRPYYALAIDPNAPPPPCHSSFFMADQPQFDQRVTIP